MTLENFSSSSHETEQNKERKSIRERIVFPHLEPIVKLMEKQFGNTEREIDPKVVEDILYAFIEQRIECAGVYSSQEHKVAFPWGVTDTAELAKKLYEQYSGESLPPQLTPNSAKKKREFMFTSLQLVQSGSQFAFMEEPMHQAIKDLPNALTALKEGREPESNIIYTLGSPTNELGTMSEEFLEKIRQGEAFDEFGALYAEFIRAEGLKEREENTEVLLYGQSMGASFATGTAQYLLEEGAVTQSREVLQEKQVPFLQIRLDMPVGSSELSPERKKWQIPIGFALDGVITAATDPYLRPVMMKDKAFLSSVQEIFTEHGMPLVMSEEQVNLKKEGIKETVNALREGTPVPKGLKVTKVVGLADPLMYSGEFRKEAKEHKEEHLKTLKYHRTFCISQQIHNHFQG